ncbi:MAG: iron transporter [Lachnospiraceae bacterium]|nr:iron transporter [Lachnospiraceae bacterium]
MKMKKLLASAGALALAVSMLAGCSSSSAAPSSSSAAETQATEAVSESVKEDAAITPGGDNAGFTETPIFEGLTAAFMDVNAVYFQPVPMADDVNPDIPAEGYDIHLECDVAANEEGAKLGYGLGDWVPYLTIDYSIVNAETGEVAAEGTFMEMSASDGPHYGQNIKLPESGTYNVTFTIHSPGENNYLIHTDAETGPGGRLSDYFGDGNLTVTYEGWEYTVQDW